MFRVLIVEDDPMVAEFNNRYIQLIDGFEVTAIATNTTEAKKILEQQTVELLLLDVYMPDENGLALLSYIRSKDVEVDVILITAASDKERIRQALRFGAVDYLIKPFEFERLEQSLLVYKEKQELLMYKEGMTQKELDKFMHVEEEASESEKMLPKGLTESTLQVIVSEIRRQHGAFFSTDELAEQTNISRVSIRKYLKFLVDIDWIEEKMTYGIGRPVYSYQYKRENDHHLHPYVSS